VSAKTELRAAVLAGAMSLEPQPVDLFEVRLPTPVRRIVDRVAPPLDLSVLPFRYRAGGGGIEPLPPRHTHGCARRRRRH
jgi:hypothetical protein